MDAWAGQDYNTMYSQLSPNARDAFPQNEFSTLYEEVWDDLKIENMSWERGSVLSQGTTVLFQYNVNFQSKLEDIYNRWDIISRPNPQYESNF